MTLPFVSCLCPTYGRAPDQLYLLAEAVEAFLRQDYPADRRELVILSDAPGQYLACPTPGAVVHNWICRLSSLGTKYNVLASLSGGDVLLPWEDDDVSLPHRISQAVCALCVRERWAGNHGATLYHYFNPQAVWYWQHGQPPKRDGGGYCHNASAFTRQAWLAVGGYPAVSGPQDAHMDGLLCRLGPVAPPLGAGDVPAYVYRFGVSDHLSGHADTEAHWREVGRRPVAQGRWEIVPGYRAETEAALAALPQPSLPPSNPPG